MRVVRLFTAMVVAALVVTACSGAAATQAPATAAPATAAPAGTAVSIKGFAFNPAEATTAVGGPVTWTNEDDSPHTVTFDDATITSSGNVAKAGTFAATFPKAGTFAYKCTIHPTMKGTVKVS